MAPGLTALTRICRGVSSADRVSCPVPWSYWLVRSPRADEQPLVRAFRDWIVTQCRA